MKFINRSGRMVEVDVEPLPQNMGTDKERQAEMSRIEDNRTYLRDKDRMFQPVDDSGRPIAFPDWMRPIMPMPDQIGQIIAEATSDAAPAPPVAAPPPPPPPAPAPVAPPLAEQKPTEEPPAPELVTVPDGLPQDLVEEFRSKFPDAKSRPAGWSMEQCQAVNRDGKQCGRADLPLCNQHAKLYQAYVDQASAEGRDDA